MTMRKYLYRHSLILFLVVLLGRGIVGMLAVKGFQMYDPTFTVQKDLGWLVMLIYATFVLLAVKWVKIDKEIGLKMPASSKDWYIWMPALAIPLTITYFLGINTTWGHLPLLLIAAAGVAINEEILFRGIILRALLPVGTAIAIIVPSLLFAVAHLGNIFVGGDLTYALFQFAWTFFAGMALTMMVLANNSLLPAITFHFILDAVEYAATGEYGVHNSGYPLTWLIFLLVLKFAFFLYAFYLFRRATVRRQQSNNVTFLLS
jgi:uncharacterized protein